MPGAGLTIRLPQLIGIDRARRMSFTGDFIDAAHGVEWGLVVEVVPHEAPAGARPGDRGRHRRPSRAENVREIRRMYDGDRRARRRGGLARPNRMVAPSGWHERFDQSRLATEREAIIARGREPQSSRARDEHVRREGLRRAWTRA